MLPTNMGGTLICLFAMLHLSNEFMQFYPQRKVYNTYDVYSSSSEEKHGPYASETTEEVLPYTGGPRAQEKIVDTRIKAVQDEIVRCHNDIRRNVNPTASDMKKMVWNEDAAQNARKVASMCSDRHSPPNKRIIKKPNVITCGENLYMSSSEDPWRDRIDDWASEVKVFRYGHGPISKGAITGHYTQVVSANTTLVGCGSQRCNNLKFPYLTVCHYCPPGNNGDGTKFPYTRGNPCSKCKGRCEDKLCIV
ncbi:allurin-like [Pyxicephalus adspersus]|uniref:allurin-like n=1 Tax=Pyxicephalus adspersus TaxID=30357 RepID=UPI003B5B9A96